MSDFDDFGWTQANNFIKRLQMSDNVQTLFSESTKLTDTSDN